MKRKLLNIDARNKNAITLMNPYGPDPRPAKQRRQPKTSGRSQRQEQIRKNGNGN